MDNYDRQRFVLGLYAFNDVDSVVNLSRDLSEIGSHSDDRNRLVDVHAWCLMGNHYHLLLSSHVENGVSKFLQKLNIGYTMYFNKRHQRSGVLFQGKTKKVLIEKEAHFNYILHYIHCNPLDLMRGGSGWRTQSLASPKAALDYLDAYRWSSYRNYSGEPEFSEILTGSDIFAERHTHTTSLKSYLRAIRDPSLEHLYLE